jgi:hypothetical protein
MNLGGIEYRFGDLKDRFPCQVEDQMNWLVEDICIGQHREPVDGDFRVGFFVRHFARSESWWIPKGAGYLK